MSTTAAEPTGAPRGGSTGAVLEIDDLHVTFKTEDGPVYSGPRSRPRGARRRDARRRGRVGLGQVGDDARRDGPVAEKRHDHRFGEVPGARAARARQERRPPLPRLEARDDLPGSVDRAEPGAEGRRPDRRSRERAPGGLWQRSAGSCDRDARSRRHPAARHARRAVPARVLGRHAPAGDDRDGDLQRPRGADRGRADDRARRDHPGPDPRGHPAGAER